jgi:hypothetical protein
LQSEVLQLDPRDNVPIALVDRKQGSRPAFTFLESESELTSINTWMKVADAEESSKADFESIFAALFAKLQFANTVLTGMGLQPGWTAVPQLATFTRVVQSWDQMSGAQPTLVLQQWALFDIITSQFGMMKWKLRGRVWIYVQVPGDTQAIAAQMVNPFARFY